MPVNVDTVYQTVQALANKEQRGYLTPQEFNLFANQAQADIFEQYFYDLSAFQKQGEQTRTVGDSITHIQHKLNNTGGVTVNPYTACTYNAGTQSWTLTGTTGGRLTGRFHYNDGTERRELIPTPGHLEDLRNLRASLWHSQTDEIFVFEDSWGTIQVHDINGPITTGVTCETVEGRPGLIVWGYLVVNEKPVFDTTNSSDFDLDASEQADLVIKILKLAGISIEDAQLYQAAAQEDQQNVQLENK